VSDRMHWFRRRIVRQRNELLIVARRQRHASRGPIRLRLLDPLPARGYEVPPYEARPDIRTAQQHHSGGIGVGGDHRLTARGEHQQFPGFVAHAVMAHGARNHIGGAFLMLGRHRHAGARRKLGVQIEQRREHAHIVAHAIRGTGDQPRPHAAIGIFR
jgi:hypothetical protein